MFSLPAVCIRAHSLCPAEADVNVEQALYQVGLWNQTCERLSHPATELTLEDQQKLCIARLLPLNPRLILMDEPCCALDGEGIASIEALLASLARQHTILIVTHNMVCVQARPCASHCLYMLEGRFG